MPALDHAILAVEDYDIAAAQILEEHGLASVVGGRHAGHGTGNRIIPLGRGYIELMAVVDPEEASSSPMGRWLLATAEGRVHDRAVCLGTRDAAAVAAAPDDPVAMTRLRPDGVELSWRLAGLQRMLETGDPFFIQWEIDPADHPSRAAADHRVEPLGLAWVEIGAGNRVPVSDLDLRPVVGLRGVGRVGVESTRGEIVL